MARQKGEGGMRAPVLLIVVVELFRELVPAARVGLGGVLVVGIGGAAESGDL